MRFPDTRLAASLSFARFGFKRSLEIDDSSVGLVRTLCPKLSRAGLLYGSGELLNHHTRQRKSIMSAEPIETSDVIGLTKVAPFSRRGFMTATAAVTAGYTLAAGPVRADVIKTDTQQLLPVVNSKPDAELLSDLDSTVAWAKSQGGDTGRLGIIGFCRGGRTVWEYSAHSGALKAGVAFYGPPVDPPNPLWPKSPTQLAPEMKAPVLGLYGEADTGIPAAQVEALKAALAEAKKPAEFKIYPGAPHGFHADYRASYRKEAAEDAWSQMQAWFKKYKVLG